MIRKVNAAVIAALILTGASAFTMASATTVESHTDGKSIGLNLWGEQRHYTDDLTVNVSGLGVNGKKYHNNVTGIYALDGTQVAIDKNVTVKITNPAPAESGEKRRPDLAHYYMSGIYAGYGGLTSDGNNDDTRVTVKGNANIDVVGVGLQANKDGYIRVLGGADIKTNPLDTSDTYSALSEEGFVYVNTGMDGLQPGTNDVKMYGNVGFLDKNYGIEKNPHNHGSEISLGLTTPNSKLVGGVLNEFDESNNNPYHGGLRLYLQNGATWRNEWLGAERVYPTQGRPDNANYLYTGSRVEYFIGGKDAASKGIIQAVDARPITINNYAGHTAIDYEKGAPASAQGKGQVVINHAEKGSSVTMHSSAEALKGYANINNPRGTLHQLANKLTYTNFNKGERNLGVNVQVDGGLISPTYSTNLGTESFAIDGKASVTDQAVITTRESELVSGAKSALAASMMQMKADTNDLQRRLGDVRLNSDKHGVWGKYIGGKSKITDDAYVNQTYNMAQVGYDTLRGDWTVGGALLYGTSNNDYALGSGSGKTAGLAVYGAKQFKDGRYLDIIGKVNRLKNDFTVRNTLGTTLSGDYRNTGASLSVEYGKRIKKDNGFYIDPNAELTFSRLSGESFDARTNTGSTVHIDSDAVNSVIGRIGVGIGKESKNSNVFLKAALAHEFSGKMNATYSMTGEPTTGSEVNLKDTWLDLELGGSWSVRPNTYIYGTFTKNFGATVDNSYRIDAGIRHNF
ncbi:MAG: autotransporter outer membrane beta-barrel domain-containing protein [Veillonella sp.]|jgi:outer membrane autotransporter barrel domain protein|uniref:autotransporter outer membrane beta-barrel domain-containing protein n=1 Tax=Veillonella sp. TaxID=1926307 RepID=UPI0010226A98|nr:autotransporter outer membrane beta-barrel domain-containing protein [Veillonella sp.]MTG96398.1 autotransporter outer membrane beta-barrel domain-containing protein [Veillonella dispar]MBS6327586.1 autotransporter outer membrane beta-barrel domain-containing protein [Veillonella sp.]MDU2931263.1 autotransporter outer membrane beta-barrel domain-containing protein [Veillonella sp.]MTH31781.1 autotransporter outer membrane beta-barrel domain-containing protein [Veillonella dispar]MTH37557.1 